MKHVPECKCEYQFMDARCKKAPRSQVKISKKNRELANEYAPIDSNEALELAHELQKRDDKIKALRAEVKALKANLPSDYAQCDDYARSMASFAAKGGE